MIAASPLIAISDMERSIAFFTDTLDFALAIRNPGGNYALVRRGGAMIGLEAGGDPESLLATRRHAAAQIWVTDLDAEWERLKSRLEALPKDQVRAPFVQPYGAREFHVKDPDGFLMFFTQTNT